MSEESDTSAIDDKKNKTTTDGNIMTFFYGLISSLFSLVIYIIIGACILYSCKVAQSKLILSNMDFMPYTNNLPDISPTVVDVNIVKTADAIFSTKLEFPVQKNIDIYNHSILNYLTSLKDSPKSNVFKLYISSIIQGVVSTNLLLLDSFYKMVNNSFTESLIIFIVPFIFPFLIFGTALVNMLLLFINWFYYVYLFLSVKTSAENKPAEWKETPISGWNIGYYLLYLFFAFIVYLFVGTFTVFIGPAIAIYSFLLPLFMEANVVNSKKPYYLKNLLSDIMKYKHSVIMYFISYYVISNANMAYGNYAALVALVMCLIIYFFISPVYKQYIPGRNDTATMGLTPERGGDNTTELPTETPSSSIIAE